MCTTLILGTTPGAPHSPPTPAPSVLDHERFAREIIAKWFKHNKWTSFVRQLNMYGFHKIQHLQQGVLKSDSEIETHQFEHPNFRRAHPDMLCLIQRKKQPDATVPEDHRLPSPLPAFPQPAPQQILPNLPSGQVLDVNSLVSGISAIKRHQQAISSELSELKKSNEHLWKETMASRERHKKHQDTINRILKFLAGVFGNAAASPVHKSDDGDSPQIDVHVPRKRQRLMIAAGRSGNTHARTASVTDDLDEDDDVDMGARGETRAFTHVNPYLTPYQIHLRISLLPHLRPQNCLRQSMVTWNRPRQGFPHPLQPPTKPPTQRRTPPNQRTRYPSNSSTPPSLHSLFIQTQSTPPIHYRAI